MLARITGANSGIGNYLRDGNKSGRFHSREQMDSREVLHGDLTLTESVIDSIPNKNQERYLHISLSFKEKDLPKEKLEEITAEYVEGLMSAYSSDEYNYYAEAHRPRLQNIYNPSTDEMDERLLHVHVVIPKRNLVSGGRLNPTGRHLSNVDYFDALQEKINQKHNLESPKENKRDILKGRTEAIARYSGEFNRNNSKSAQIKARALEDTKGADYQTFKERLASQGEIKVRNKGKVNEYIAVKFEGESRFTNLRESVFSPDFLDDKTKPVAKQNIEDKLDYWQNIRSREIKYISDASRSVREQYSNAESRAEKLDYLNQRSEYFYQKHGFAQDQKGENDELSISRPSANQPSDNKSSRGRPRTRGGARSHSLQELQKRTLVHQQRRTLLLLQGNANPHAHAEESRADTHEGLRRPLHGGRRGLATEGQTDSYMAQVLDDSRKKSGTRSASANELNSIDSRHVIDYCAKHYLIDTNEVAFSRSKTGAPRIQVGSRNYTNTDYLTKEINLKWPEAKAILNHLYSENSSQDKQPSHINSEEVKREWREFTSNVNSTKGEGAKEIRRIKEHFAKERAAIMDEYRLDRKQIKVSGLSREDRIYQTALSVRQKMVRLEALSEQQANTISAARNSIKPFGETEVTTMKNLQSWEERNAEKSKASELQDKAFYSHESAIRPAFEADSAEAVKRNMENAAHNAQAVHKPGLDALDLPKISINDLGVKKSKHGADFTYNNQVLFRDHGDHISTSKETSQEMAELTLSYAVNRYGSQLEIKGSDDFKEKIVKAAYDKNFKVQFSDQGMNEKLKSMHSQKNETSGNSVREALDSREGDLNVRMDKLTESLRLHHMDGGTLSETDRQDATRSIERAMETSDGEIGGNDATSRLANKIGQNHQHRAMGAARALAHFDNGENPFNHDELKKVYDSEKRFTAYREAREDQTSQQVDTLTLDEWDHSYRDEDGFTNAEHSAIAAGRDLEEVPDQVSKDPGLLSAYIQGAKQGRDDAEVASGELKMEATELNQPISDEYKNKIDAMDRKIERANTIVEFSEARLKDMKQHSDQQNQGRGGQPTRKQDQDFGMD